MNYLKEGTEKNSRVWADEIFGMFELNKSLLSLSKSNLKTTFQVNVNLKSKSLERRLMPYS